MDDFDRAVQVMYDPSTSDLQRRSAEQRLNQIVGSREGIQLVIDKVYDARTSDTVKLISIKYIQSIIDMIAMKEAGLSQVEIPDFIIELIPKIKADIASWPVKFLSNTNPSPGKKINNTLNVFDDF